MRHLIFIAGLLFMQTAPAAQPMCQVWKPIYANQNGFNAAYAPLANTLCVYRNGLLLAPGVDYAYTPNASNTINFTNSPADLAQPGDVWVFNYQH